jgi:hypothetical protein
VQGNLGDRLSIISNKLKGGVAMVKTVLSNVGLKTALVVFGWFSFIISFFVNGPFLTLAFQAIARVLP